MDHKLLYLLNEFQSYPFQKSKTEKLKKQEKSKKLSDVTVNSIFTKMGLERYPITADPSVTDKTFHRYFLRDTLGGSSMPTDVVVKTKKGLLQQEHEVDFYLCPSLEFNPNTARIPGAPGLLMYGTPREDNRRRGAIQPIFTNISTTESQLLYMGEYELLTSRLLARQEWLEQPYEVSRWSIHLALIR